MPRQRRALQRHVDPAQRHLAPLVGPLLLGETPQDVVDAARRVRAVAAARLLELLRHRAVHAERLVHGAFPRRDRDEGGQEAPPPREIANAEQEVRLAGAVGPLHQLEARPLRVAQEVAHVHLVEEVQVRLVADVDVGDPDVRRFPVLAHLREDPPREAWLEPDR